MTKDQILSTIQRYDRLCGQYGVTPTRISKTTFIDDIVAQNREIIAHMRYMIAEIPKLLEADKIEKAMRWLGFVQGVMWSLGIYNLETLRDDNR